jgi:hypothetical protein
MYVKLRNIFLIYAYRNYPCFDLKITIEITDFKPDYFVLKIAGSFIDNP